MKLYKLSLVVGLILMSLHMSNAQNESENTDKTAQPAFRAMKIGNLQTTKVAEKGTLHFIVSHRFGTLEGGIATFFGLDNASTKFHFIYGLFDNVHIGFGRESLRKTYDFSAKMKFAQQGEKFPLNIVGYTTMNINAELKEERYPFLKFEDRLSYASQLLISKRFNNLSLEIVPTFVRQNLVLEPFQEHNQVIFGIGGRMKLSKRLSLNMDYAYNFDRHEDSVYQDPLTIGLDIDTGGHVFQLVFSNAQSSNEPGFLSNAEGDWGDGDVFFGFNIVRVF